MKLKSLIYNVLFGTMLLFIVSCSNNSIKSSGNENNNVEKLTDAAFKEKVFDYSSSRDWTYKGDIPCIIDFYATWCGPCKRLSPTIDKLSIEYKGKVKFYKVDVDEEKDLASAFGVESIPTIYFCPVGSKPVIEYGALPRENIVSLIDSTFKQLAIKN